MSNFSKIIFKSFSIITAIIIAILIYFVATTKIPSAKCKWAQAEIEVLATAIDNYYLDTSAYPDNKCGLDCLIENYYHDEKWKGPYLKMGIPRDPWKNKYVYIFPSRYGNKPYDLYSFGKNGKDDFGQADDITNWKGINYIYYDPYYYLKITGLVCVAILMLIPAFFLFAPRKNIGKE